MHHADYRDPASSGRACRNWARSGTCLYGDHCNFTHNPGDRGASVEPVPQGAFVRPYIRRVIGEPAFQISCSALSNHFNRVTLGPFGYITPTSGLQCNYLGGCM